MTEFLDDKRHLSSHRFRAVGLVVSLAIDLRMRGDLQPAAQAVLRIDRRLGIVNVNVDPDCGELTTSI